MGKLYCLIVIFVALQSTGVRCQETHTVDASLVNNVHEFCEWEAFNVTCPPSHVMRIHSARYGRMRIGRCVEIDYGNVGCNTDVTIDLDSRCSGKRQCVLDVISLHYKRSCPNDLKSYLEVDYHCAKVVSPPSSCPEEGYVHIPSATGQISNSLYNQAKAYDIGKSNNNTNIPGSYSCPWSIHVQPYQTLNISMEDFSVMAQDGLWYSLPEDQYRANTCRNIIGYIVELDRNVTLCAGVRRHTVVYMSLTNAVHIILVNKPTANVILSYSAVGCAPLEAPANAHVRMTHNMASVECNNTRESWYLTCRGTTWIGSYSNCSKPGLFLAEEESWSESESILNSLPLGILLVVALGVVIGVAIGVMMLMAVLAYYKRRKQRRIRSRSNYVLHPVDESKYQVTNGLPLDFDHDTYADRCTLLLRSDPYRCHTISRDYNTAKECTMKLKRSRSTHSAGNILDGVMVTSLPSPNIHPSASLGDCAVGNQNYISQRPGDPYNSCRDKSMDYKWDSVSIQDNINNHAVDAQGNGVSSPQMEIVTPPCPENAASQVNTDAIQRPFIVALNRRNEPYYFKYDPNRMKLLREQGIIPPGDDAGPDIVTGCVSCAKDT